MRLHTLIATTALATALGSGISAPAALAWPSEPVAATGRTAAEAAPDTSPSSAALRELRRARTAMLAPEDAPYAGVISWRIPRPDHVQVVADPWDEVSHACAVSFYSQLGGEAFRNRILVSETATTYDASVEQDVVLFPDASTADAAYAQLASELATCQQRLAEWGSDLVVTPVGDVSDASGGEGTVWNADFTTSEPEFLEDVTMAVVVRGRAVSVFVVSRYGTLPTYDPASVLPTAEAALARLGEFA